MKLQSRLAAMSVCTALAVATTAVAAEGGWLSLCSKCLNPSVFASSGLGTANAVAQARITRRDAEDHCANWQPGDKTCVAQQLASEDVKKVYRASANCPAGSITAVDGKTYRLAGVWDSSDIGAGRSRWRDAAGRIVGRDNASGGLAISQQWELLCPGTAKGGLAAKPAASPAPARTPTAMPATPSQPPSLDEFAAGQTVLARYGGEWVRARINQIRRQDGPQGPQIVYDVTLANGKRGIVPRRMLRRAP